MRQQFRDGFYAGLSIALLAALFLIWLWRPEHQVKRHSDDLLLSISHRNWKRVAAFIGDDYQDQWGNDRALLLERTREVFQYLRGVEIKTVAPNVRVENRNAFWRGIVLIDGNDNELMAAVKERVNGLRTPFELEWRRMSAKPWDWKLVSVKNERLEIPSEFQ